MRFIENDRYVYLVSSLFGLLVLNALYLEFSGDARFLDGELTFEEMYWWDLFTLYTGFASIMVIWVSSAIHCFKNFSKLIAVVIFIIWPASFLYYWGLWLKRQF